MDRPEQEQDLGAGSTEMGIDGYTSAAQTILPSPQGSRAHRVWRPSLQSVPLQHSHKQPALHFQRQHLSQRNEDLCSHKNLYMNVYDSYIHNGPKLEKKRMSFNR